MGKDIRYKKGISPGELYSEIIVERSFEEEDDEKLVKEKPSVFVSFCKRLYAFAPSLGQNAKFTPELQEAVRFLNWDLKPAEFSAASKLALIISLLIGLIIAVIAINLGPVSDFLKGAIGDLGPMVVFAVPLVLALYITNFIQQFPLNAALMEQRKALTYVPEIIGYLIMSLKLTPNLEKGLEFASKNGKGKISEDFKKILWDIQLGTYDTVAEALDELAYKWGKYSSEFKQALMMVRASILEETEAKRYALLDKTMENILASIKDKMEQYARDLSQPSIVLFYIGVLLPLILIIILPVGSAFTGSPLAQPLVLILIYNVGIPLFAYFYALKVIRTRPPTYEPPIIQDNYPGLPKKWKMKLGTTEMDVRFLVAIVFVLGIIFSVGLSTQGLPPKFLMPDQTEQQIVAADKSYAEVLDRAGRTPDYFDDTGTLYQQYVRQGLSEEKALDKVKLDRAQFFNTAENDVTPSLLVFGVIITFAICIYLFFHYSTVYKRKAQMEIMELESEFKDSLYVLASRLGESRPVEEALEHTRRFLPNLKISERVFGKTIDNIRMMSLPLEQAVFHPVYGSLVNVPSKIVQGGMKIMVDSVQLGVNVAAKTLISLSLQLENSEKVNKVMRDLVSEITNMMITMSTFIAPVVLGITTALQKVVMVTLASIIGSNISNEPQGSSLNLPPGVPLGSDISSGVSGNFLKPDAFGSMVTPLQFLLIVGFYVIELAVIMIFYVTKVQEDNDLMFKMNLAKFLPISMVAFVAAVIASNLVVAGFGGG
ncbi:MAG: type II secretion system F family protein [Candidatus Diapherotrites archaeon]|nr:type II secretion system F family protein [Candidatus Diapherotrites archaeon]